MANEGQSRGPNAPWILMAHLWLQHLHRAYSVVLREMTEVEAELGQLSLDQAGELMAAAKHAQRLQEEAGALHEQFETLKSSILDMARQDTEFLERSREDQCQ